MRTSLIAIFVAAAFLCVAAAQEAAPNTGTGSQAQSPAQNQSAPSSLTQPVRNTRIAPGSVIPVQLTKSIDAKKAKTGDEIDAEVTEDLKAGNGEIIVPKSTKVVGRVTEAQPRNKEQKESQVGIAFDHAVMKNGNDVPLPMSIQAIIAPSYLSGGNNNGASSEGTAQPSSTPAGGGMTAGNNRASGMGTPQVENPSASADDTPAKSNASTHQPITGTTQGVLGIPNLQLAATADSTHGSVLSSEKNNVKLDGGTLLLLRVNQ